MDEITQQVNLALDRLKTAHGLSESALAAQLGVTRAVVWRWRHGRFSRAFRTIIPRTVLASTPLPAGWAEQAVDIRILAPLLAIPQIDA